MADIIQNGRTIERRKEQRNDLTAFVQYTCSPETSDTFLKGRIKNYSYSGICMVVGQPFTVGQEIILKSMGVPSSKRATVRWQENIGKDVYGVGLEHMRYLFDNNSILARFIRFIFGIVIGGLLLTVLVWISTQLGFHIPLVAAGLFLLFVGISFAVWGDKFFKVLKYFL